LAHHTKILNQIKGSRRTRFKLRSLYRRHSFPALHHGCPRHSHPLYPRIRSHIHPIRHFDSQTLLCQFKARLGLHLLTSFTSLDPPLSSSLDALIQGPFGEARIDTISRRCTNNQRLDNVHLTFPCSVHYKLHLCSPHFGTIVPLLVPLNTPGGARIRYRYLRHHTLPHGCPVFPEKTKLNCVHSRPRRRVAPICIFHPLSISRSLRSLLPGVFMVLCLLLVTTVTRVL